MSAGAPTPVDPPRVRVGLVGCGRMGGHHARIVAADPRSALVWVHDVRPDRAARLAELHGASTDADLPVDVVVVATPATTHAAVARLHLALGRSCLVEKPLAADPDDARALLDPRVSVGHVERFNPAIRAVPDLAPRRVAIRRECLPPDRVLDVDAVLDLLIHDLDLLGRWAADLVIHSVTPTWAGGRIEAVDVAVDGRCRGTGAPITATLVASRLATRGVRSAQIFEGGRYTRLDLRTGTAVRDGRVLARPAGDALSAQWSAFLDRRAGAPSAVATAEDGFAAVLLADAVRRAAAPRVPPPPRPGYSHAEGWR